MFENLEFGGLYRFKLSDGSYREGKLEYMDEAYVTLWNDNLGETEFKKEDCIYILPIMNLEDDVKVNEPKRLCTSVFDSTMDKLKIIRDKYGEDAFIVTIIHDDLSAVFVNSDAEEEFYRMMGDN